MIARLSRSPKNGKAVTTRLAALLNSGLIAGYHAEFVRKRRRLGFLAVAVRQAASTAGNSAAGIMLRATCKSQKGFSLQTGLG